ncbi:exodeoxyribonuclease VII large subunit [Aestuariibacter sp. GS-14]|uniref:exodeoxyribonuclease VII large subunit n=1 Tax=Alteromonadaceae TaxID=72275 RepID=UPI00112AEF96|nr:exodeoxyribonuclease VII large subunit [Aestuariibacter sp. GS-14]TPV56053.1 exodeoxyribonuclease VII large subunit [Aestuariibacter sp. GS-14]
MLSNTAPQGQKVHTVTTLNRLARNILTSEIGLVWLTAEISNLTRAASGHWYFTLKDDKAQVRAAMFRAANSAVRQPPREGDRVLVRASVGLYEPRGDYQLIVETMQPEGEGQLKLAFEKLKFSLHAEGLFDQSRKQSLPKVIRRVGVITSAQGAALHDVLSVLKRRSPATEVIIYPSMVQGEQASKQLMHQLWIANQRNEVDVLLLTRGGGSMEDLWCFNDESLAREIARSAIPVVSAVGHEVDVTIADFVADLRAPTPSAAAELVSMDQSESVSLIRHLTRRLAQSTQSLIQRQTHRLMALEQRLIRRHPSTQLNQQSQGIDRLEQRLHLAMNRQLSQAQRMVQQQAHRLQRQHPQIRLEALLSRCHHSRQRLLSLMQRKLESNGQRLASMAHLLQSVSPLATLSRGYSITLNNDKAITSVAQVTAQDTLVTRVKDGEITSLVTHCKPLEDSDKSL